MTNRSARLFVCFTVLVAACTGSTDSGSAAGSEPDETWLVDSVPSVTIGTVDGPPETLLFRAIAALVMSDGTIVIANAGTSEIRWFDEQGNFLRNVGGQGEGPGEFRSLTDIWRIRGDTILAWDNRLRRVSFLAPDGNFVGSRTFVIPPIPLPSGISLTNSITFRGALADGSIVAMNNTVASRNLGTGMTTTSEGYRRVDNHVLLFPRDTLPLAVLLEPRSALDHDTLGIFAGGEEFEYTAVVRPGGPEQQTYSEVIFGERFLWAIGPESFAAGAGKPYSVNLHDRTGNPTRSVGRDVAPVRTTPELVRRFREDQVAQTSAEYREVRAASLERVPAAEVLPAYRAVEFDREGNLWVEEFGLTQDAPRVFSVFATDGRWLARVSVPNDLTIIDRGPDYLLTRARDDLDVEQIRLFRIRPTGR